MALRAADLDTIGNERVSLDMVAADFGVSRETARRARNELLRALHSAASDRLPVSAVAMSVPEVSAIQEMRAKARALRRMLTMTGPLPWDEVLSAWARAGGKAPYFVLPTDAASMRLWAEGNGGFMFAPESGTDVPVTIDVVAPEDLDQVSHFLLDALRGHVGGLGREALLEAAEGAGLKATTIATTLSYHPAVTRVGRGTWALRGHREGSVGKPVALAPLRRAGRVRPTAFRWGAEGALVIEFSVPRGPSPVIAVPKAVAGFVEGREFAIQPTSRPARVSVGNARLWGFGPLLSERGMSAGQRAQLELNLINGTARFAAVVGKEMRR